MTVHAGGGGSRESRARRDHSPRWEQVPSRPGAPRLLPGRRLPPSARVPPAPGRSGPSCSPASTRCCRCFAPGHRAKRGPVGRCGSSPSSPIRRRFGPSCSTWSCRTGLPPSRPREGLPGRSSLSTSRPPSTSPTPSPFPGPRFARCARLRSVRAGVARVGRVDGETSDPDGHLTPRPREGLPRSTS